MSVSQVSHTTATGFRAAIQKVVEDAFPGIRVRPGRVDGAQRQRPVACVWPISRARVSDHALEENVTLGVRVWKRWEDPKDPDQPVDPAPLEEMSETLLAALGRAQTSVGTWFIDVPAVSFDVEAQGIEATVVGRQWNPFGMCEEDV